MQVCKKNYAIRRLVEQQFAVLESFLREHTVLVFKTLNPPASAQQLKEVETRLQIKIPEALKHMYRMHNGQEYTSFFSNFGFFGNGIVFENCKDIRLFKLDTCDSNNDSCIVEIASNADFSNLVLVIDVSTEKIMLVNVNDDSYYTVADSIVQLLGKMLEKLQEKKYTYSDKIFNYELWVENYVHGMVWELKSLQNVVVLFAKMAQTLE